jgi:uncharacterized repeat protein (TIGR03803 family)
MDKHGNPYGPASQGGSSGYRIVWKVSPQGPETVLHHFARGASDGIEPYAGVIMDAKGNLYGNTFYGGNGQCSSQGCRTIYELDKKGVPTVLHTFDGSEGEFPVGSRTREAKGSLLGITLRGREPQ